MGVRFRKSKQIGPFRVTASKSGVSASFGGKGARITKTASGKMRTTLSAPGTGLSYVSETGGRGKKQTASAERAQIKASKAERKAAAVDQASAPLYPWTVRVLGILVVVIGFALCALFAPLGLAVMAFGVYGIVKARQIADRTNKESRSAGAAPPAEDLKPEGPVSGVTFSGSVHAQMLQITRTDEQVEMLRSGYKENFDNEIFEPGTVWAIPRSKVYHYRDVCCGTVLAEAVPIAEGEALRRGLHRCKKCDWHGTPVPAPSDSPMPDRRPVSKAKVEPADQ